MSLSSAWRTVDDNIVHNDPIPDEAREVVADISYLLVSMLYSLGNEVLSQGRRISEYLALLYSVLKGRSLHMMCMVLMEYKLLAPCVCSVPVEINFSSNVLIKET